MAVLGVLLLFHYSLYEYYDIRDCDHMEFGGVRKKVLAVYLLRAPPLTLGLLILVR